MIHISDFNQCVSTLMYFIPFYSYKHIVFNLFFLGHSYLHRTQVHDHVVAASELVLCTILVMFRV